ncbi:MAG: hypothetical protein J2O47_06450, partial [Acidimicrobiaceae bacterium]|nr:hypothetical protein [Acidimicrobiaceae bacterium]
MARLIVAVAAADEPPAGAAPEVPSALAEYTPATVRAATIAVPAPTARGRPIGPRLLKRWINEALLIVTSPTALASGTCGRREGPGGARRG